MDVASQNSLGQIICAVLGLVDGYEGTLYNGGGDEEGV